MLKDIRDTYSYVSSLYFDIVLSGIRHYGIVTERDGANLYIKATNYSIYAMVDKGKIVVLENFGSNKDYIITSDFNNTNVFFEAIDSIKLEMYQELVGAAKARKNFKYSASWYE